MLVGLDRPLAGGELRQGSDPHSGAIVLVRGETFKVESETADLWQPKWNENQTVLRSHTYTGQGCRSPGRHKGWELEFGDCGAIPRQALLLPEERLIEGM